jgi:hypothetical protein
MLAMACRTRTSGPYYVVSFLETEANQAKRGREYWVEERDEEPHPDRASWFERM